MPNWCENELSIGGDRADLRRFRKEAKGGDTALSLNKLYPMPRELEDTQAPSAKPNERLLEKYGADNWYDWRIKNWGTKWDVEAKLAEKGDGWLVYRFDSAWSPPIAWLEKVARDYPMLSFRLKYDEPGVGFAGVATAQDGQVSEL